MKRRVVPQAAIDRGAVSAAATTRGWRRSLRGLGGEAAERERRKLVGHLAHAEPPARVVPLVQPVEHAEQTVGNHLHVEVRAKLAGLHPLAEDLLPESLVRLRRELRRRAKPPLQILGLAEIDEEMRMMAVKGFQMGEDGPAQLFGRRRLGCEDLADRLVEPRDRLLDDEIEQLLLALEMVVEAALEDADLVGDVLHGRGVIALGLEHLRCRYDDLVKLRHLTNRLVES